MSLPLAIGLPQGMEWIYILIIILLLFGAKKLPELARGLGLGIKEFKKAAKEVTDEVENPSDDKSSGGDKSGGAPPSSKG